MKLFFRIIFKIFLILTILVGCATIEETKETDSIAHLNQGTFFVKKGQYDRSIACFNKAIAINPKLAMAYNNRGIAYGKGKGQCDRAISDFNKAIEINPRYAVAYYNRGVTYFYIREYDKAWDDVYKAKNLGYKVHPGFLKALHQATGI